jgi:hypothetical protein
MKLLAPQLHGPAARPKRASSVRQILAVLVSLVVLAALAAPTAAPKDIMWLRICGENGCKLIKDQGVGAALATEAEAYGAKVRASVQHLPMYEVTYVLPSSTRRILRTEGLTVPRQPTYWLPQRSIRFVIATSQRSVSGLFLRATAGIRPFTPTSNQSSHWQWFTALSSAGAGVLAGTLVLFRRRTRADAKTRDSANSGRRLGSGPRP